MGQNTPATTNTTSNSAPWAAATPLLQNLITKYGSANTDVTGNQTTALNGLWDSASSTPNFGNTAATGVNRLFNTDTSPQAGMVQSAYDSMKTNLTPDATGANLNPWSTPGFSDAINTGMQDITNQVKGVYAGSGRDPSGAGSFGQSLGRGLTQGIAPIIQSQFNTNKANMNSANSALFGGANTAAGSEASLGQLPLTNILQGMQGAGMIPGLYTQPSSTMLSAANAAQSQPFANLAPLLTAGTGIGALGTNSNGVSTQTPANNPLMNYLGAGMMGAGLMFSDERLKEDIHRVGKLDDGQNVYTYRYKGSDTPQLGLIAQEVAEHVPEAVHDVGGALAVDYSLATRRARRLPNVGMLDLEAA